MMGEVVLTPNPLVWDQGGRQKARKLAIRINVDLASLPGPGFLSGPWIQVHGGHVSVRFRFTSFLGTLHWPTGSDDFGHFGFFFGASGPF